MIDAAQMQHLVLVAERNGIAELELSSAGFRLLLRLSPAGERAEATPSALPFQGQPARWAASPAVGVFRLSHPVTERRPVGIGERVLKDQIVGFLEVGRLVRPVTADADGVLGPPLVEDGAVVGYGERLFALT